MTNRAKTVLTGAEPDVLETPTAEAPASGRLRSPFWTKPVLTAYGDLRQLTMGTSPATGESGNPLNFRI